MTTITEPQGEGGGGEQLMAQQPYLGLHFHPDFAILQHPEGTLFAFWAVSTKYVSMLHPEALAVGLAFKSNFIGAERNTALKKNLKARQDTSTDREGEIINDNNTNHKPLFTKVMAIWGLISTSR